MNAELALLKDTALFAAEVAVVCLLGLGCEVFVRSASWRRTLWQVCVVSVLLVTGLELSGLSRSIGESMRQTAPSKPKPAMVDPIPRPLPTATVPQLFQPSVWPTVQTQLKPAPAKDRARQIILVLACVWLLGTGALLGRIILTRIIMFIICAMSTRVIDPALLRMARELAARMGIGSAIGLIESERFRGPIAFGLARRIIGLPLHFGSQYSPAQQEVIVAHELAHLAARDSWWQLLVDAAVALLWWHPLVWLARQRLQEAAETAADEASLIVPNGPPVLAECLLALGKQLKRAPGIRWSSIGGDGFRSGLGRRVQRLLELREVARHPRKKVQMVVARTFCPAVLVLGTVLSSGWMSPVASMKGTMKNPMWKRSLPAFALLAFLGADQPVDAADKAAPAAADKPTALPAEAVSRNEAKPAARPRGAQWVRRKLERITLDFQADNLPLGSIISLLVDEARKRDPEKEGINILLYMSYISDPRPAIDPATGLPIPGTAPEPVDLNAVTIRVMPPLLNVRLIDVLDVMMKAADRPLRYSIEDYGVVITEAKSKAGSNLETRTFIVNPPEIFFKGIKSAFGIDVPKLGESTREAQQQIFQDLFRHLGIDWASPKSVFYNELTGIVMVRAAPEDMMVITATMQTLGGSPLSDAPATAAKIGK